MVDFLGRLEAFKTKVTSKRVSQTEKIKPSRDKDIAVNRDPNSKQGKADTQPHFDLDPAGDNTAISLEALRVNSVYRLSVIEQELRILEAHDDFSEYIEKEAPTPDDMATAPINNKSAARRAASAYEHAGETKTSSSQPSNNHQDALVAEYKKLRTLIPRIDALLASDIREINLPRGLNFMEAVKLRFDDIELDTDVS